MIRFKEEIVRQLGQMPGLSEELIRQLITKPAEPSHGDYAVPCFRLAKEWRRRPDEIARELARQWNPIGAVASAESVGPYLNFKIDPRILTRSVLEEIGKKRPDYGSDPLGAGETVVIDYSSPNIAKPFHMGHLRSTILGNALKQIFSFLGYRVVSINFLGDWGTQFGLLALAYQQWGDDRELEARPIRYLYELYVKINQAAQEDPAIQEAARELFRRMEEGDPGPVGLWNRFRTLSIREYERVYSRLGVHFDLYSGESFYRDKVQGVVEELKAMGLLQISQGAAIVDLAPWELNVALLAKSDGATLYLTRDLAAAHERHTEYGFNRLLYVVGSDQRLHFAQLFKILELMGRPWADRCAHVDFGRILGMSTRRGQAVFLEDVLDEGKRRALEKMQANPEKFAEVEDPDLTADICGMSAIIFSDLSRRRVKDYEFDWEQVLAFEGDTGLYLQNAHARVGGIMRKSGVTLQDAIDHELLLGEGETLDLVRHLAAFPEVVLRAAEEYEPALICTYLIGLARLLHQAYKVLWVQGRPTPLAEARLKLLWSVKQVLSNGMRLLGMNPLERM
ncbi:MAG: arginine--tRNA ligase [Candidatus Tectomicrobia bacterium]|uniref:Arginine--tRNA ligase n=1 Tax=Tectimicrobiota bacterium TaxID=2528274 RepID=A0A932FXM6_UNCTE|nr:arginine--tRNA ligase [Candidatus Tectomicrobia bacterium]